MLVLVNQYRLRRLHKPAGISTHRRPRSRIIAIDHRPSQPPSQLAEERTLAYRPRPIKDKHRFLGEPSLGHIDKTALRQAGQDLTHAPMLLIFSRIPRSFFPLSAPRFPVFRKTASANPRTAGSGTARWEAEERPPPARRCREPSPSGCRAQGCTTLPAVRYRASNIFHDPKSLSLLTTRRPYRRFHAHHDRNLDDATGVDIGQFRGSRQRLHVGRRTHVQSAPAT